MVGTGRLPGEVGVPWRPHVVKCVLTCPETSLSVVLETAVAVCFHTGPEAGRSDQGVTPIVSI